MIMASSLDFVEYVCDQISGAGGISYRKMLDVYKRQGPDSPSDRWLPAPPPHSVRPLFANSVK